ncbi:hypothetical protein Tco_0538470 [Tanacetum coccineum]
MTTSKLSSLIGVSVIGGILRIEARDMDTKLLSAPESNNTLARCWFKRNVPVTTFESIISTPDYIYPIIVPSDSNVEDAFSSTTTPDYIAASPDYFPASLGNTSSDPSEDLSKDLLASLAISPFHDDPYMKVIQAYNATSNESPIPSPRAPIAPPTIFPLSPVLPSSPLFDPRDFFLPEEILPPQK